MFGCSTYEAVTGKAPGSTTGKSEAVFTAFETDLRTIAPIASAVHPLGGIAIEGLLALVAIGGALFGGKQRRVAQRAYGEVFNTQEALNTLVSVIEGLNDPDLKEKIFKASVASGTIRTIHSAVSQLPVQK